MPFGLSVFKPSVSAPSTPTTSPVLHLTMLKCRRVLYSTKKMLDNQAVIPRIPIPSLDNLKDKYLASCKPLLTHQNFETTSKIVDEFLAPTGFGAELQQRLIEYEKKQPNSWVYCAYLAGKHMAQQGLPRMERA
jgi:Choline/Carnitine o-acyltransferase